jgi:hypothetical protein
METFKVTGSRILDTTPFETVEHRKLPAFLHLLAGGLVKLEILLIFYVMLLRYFI